MKLVDVTDLVKEEAIPYTNCKIFGPYTRKDGRQIVIVQNASKKKTTVSYPKFLVECQLGRKLDPNEETIDHMDDNFYNNDPDNLRVLPRSKHSRQDNPMFFEESFTCPVCGVTFTFSGKQVQELASRRRQGYTTGPFCSRTCTGKYGANIKKGPFIKETFYSAYLPSKRKEKTILNIEPFTRNGKSGVGDIGEALTGNADGNTEGTLEKVSAVETRYPAT
jgi:hypothetical protein